MTSRMGAGWVPERQRHQFLVGVVSWQNLVSIKGRAGTDGEGGVLLLIILLNLLLD